MTGVDVARRPGLEGAGEFLDESERVGHPGLYRAVGHPHRHAELERHLTQGQVGGGVVSTPCLLGFLTQLCRAIGDQLDRFAQHLRFRGLGHSDLAPGADHSLDQFVEDGPWRVFVRVHHPPASDNAGGREPAKQR
ncbi:hypothetical protein [Microbacterium aurum]|uniref:hypothetical protein n=1 Tax=Microbacterium aurum TaxID=36805 RepID=UPI0028E51C26|nr:hypothetical protein [Microbacterium aurum]